MDAPNPRGALHLVSHERLEEEDLSTSVAPSVTKRIFRFSATFSFLVLIGAGSALAWRSYGDQATGMIRAFTPPFAEFLSRKPAAPPLTAAEIQQQLSSITLNLVGVKRMVEQLTANQDQLTRTQGQMAQSLATLQAAHQELSQKLASAPVRTPVSGLVPVPRPVQHPAQLSTGASPKPGHLPPPKSLQPPDR